MCQCGWWTSQKAPPLDDDLQIINGCQERQNQSSPGMSPQEVTQQSKEVNLKHI